MSKPFRTGRLLLGACLLFSFSLLLAMAIIPIGTGPDRSPNIDADRLIARYAPVLHFDTNETLFPSDVGHFVSNCRLMHWENGGGIEVERNATILAMSALGRNATSYYLDNTLGSLDDGAIERWYLSQDDRINNTVYCRFASSGGRHLIQYWMFYGFNNGSFNRHEGDWELFQIILDAHLQPTEAMFSQHQSGSRASWGTVNKNASGVPEVYVTRGSHGLSHLPGSIDMSGTPTVLRPDDYDLVELTNATTDAIVQPWLAFGGRWGEWGGSYGELLGTRGPQGPMFRSNGSMWEGVQWGMALPSLGSEAEALPSTSLALSIAESIPQVRAILSDRHIDDIGGAWP